MHNSLCWGGQGGAQQGTGRVASNTLTAPPGAIQSPPELLGIPTSRWYPSDVTATIEAVYENGVLRLSGPLPLKDKTKVVVVIQTESEAAEDGDRQDWLRHSQLTLMKAWHDPADDIFNELLDK